MTELLRRASEIKNVAETEIPANKDSQKAKPEMTPEANYVLNNTSMGTILKLLMKGHSITDATKQMRGTATKDITQLQKKRVIEVNKGIAIIKHPENLEIFFENTNGAKVLELLSQNPELSVKDIARKLDRSINWANKEANKLLKEGLMEKNDIYNMRIFSIDKKGKK